MSVDLKRLREAITASRATLQIFRENRNDAIRQFVGHKYSDGGATKDVPVNLIELSVNIFTRQLAARSPAVTVSTKHTVIEGLASSLGIAADKLLEEIKFGKTLARFVKDAMFSVGIMKVGLDPSKTVEIGGFDHDVGQPFAEVVSLDDWVHDTHAKTWEQIQFCGNRYRVSREAARKSGLFSRKALDAIKGDDRTPMYNDGGDERTDNIGRGNEPPKDEYKETLELWDMWIPDDAKIVTLAANDESMPELGDREWSGPKNGPYHMLSFEEVPDHIMPLAPVALQMPLHELSNTLFRKLSTQGADQKTILGVQGGSEKDAERVVAANDGEVIKMDNPKGMQEYKFAGIDQATLAMFLQSKDLFSWVSGNLDSLGGLSPMSETIGQDKLLNQNASQRVADMQAAVVSTVRGIVKDLCWYLFYDPLLEVPMTKQTAAGPLDTVLTAEDLEGDFLEYNFDIEPYSMQHQTPEGKLSTVLELLNGVVAPFLPMLEAQGKTIDWDEMIQFMANSTNIPELTKMFTDVDNFAQGQPEPGPIGKPPVTKRTYERVNRTGATRPGKDMAMIQALMGKGVQDSEAAVGIPVG